MSPMKAMAVRRWRWRREMQTNPLDWDQPYSWLRAELADLERARKASLAALAESVARLRKDG